MKIIIDKNAFMRSWQIAERIVSPKSPMAVLSGILCSANEDKTELISTDLKTSVRTEAVGVTAEEPGKAVFPVKIVGELFKKIPTPEFKVSVDSKGTGLIVSGRNRYRFSTYPSEDFPAFASSKGAEHFCDLEKSDLERVLDEGGIAGSLGEEFPKYLGAQLLRIKEGLFNSVSTDGRRLSLSKVMVQEDSLERDMLLPIKSIKELLKIMASIETENPVKIHTDGTLAYFTADNLEFSVRMTESNFPNYEKILNPNTTTTMEIDRSQFIEALERVDVVVKGTSRMVVLVLSPGGDLNLWGRAPEIGEAQDVVDAMIKGEALKVAFNVGYLIDGLKAFHGDRVSLSFNGQEGQMMMLRPGEKNFLYMLMPMKLKSSDLDGLDNQE